MYITVNVILAALIAATRVNGVTLGAYQALVHCYMGGLVVCWFFFKREGKLDLSTFSIWLWWGLNGVEIVMSAPKLYHGFMALWTRLLT